MSDHKNLIANSAPSEATIRERALLEFTAAMSSISEQWFQGGYSDREYFELCASERSKAFNQADNWAQWHSQKEWD